jgi:hypothetical protein
MDKKALQKWEQEQREKAIAEIKKRGCGYGARRYHNTQIDEIVVGSKI